MNNETAIVIGLVLALLLVASLYSATEGTLGLAEKSLDDISGDMGTGEVTPSSYEQREEYGGELAWRKGQRLLQL
jgi:hypothetical protein